MKDVLLSRPFVSLFFQNFFFYCSANALNTFPGSLEKMGASKTYIGMFMNLNSLFLVLSVLFAWRFISKLDRKKLLLTGYALGFLSYALMLLCPDNLKLLILFKVLGAPLYMAGFTLHVAELFEIIPKNKRVAGIAVFGISGLISNPAVSALGETLTQIGGHRTLYVLGMVMAIPAATLVAKHTYHQPAPNKDSISIFNVFAQRNLRPLLFCALIYGGSFAVYVTFLANLTLAKLGVAIVTPYFIAFSLTAIASRFFFSNIMDTLPRKKLLTLAFGSLALSYSLTFFLTDSWILIPMGIFYGLGHSMLFPILSTLFVNSGPAEQLSVRNNAFSVFYTLGCVVLAMLLGSVGDLLGVQWIFWSQGTLALLALVVVTQLKNLDAKPVPVITTPTPVPQNS